MQGLVRTLSVLAQWIDGFNQRLGRGLAWLTLAMVAVTFAVVVLRYGFNLGWIAMQESVMYLHSFVFLGAAGYTLLHNNHVRVDVFYNRMTDRGRAWVNLLGSLFLLIPVFSFILYSSWGYVLESWYLLEESPETGGLPFVYILKSAIPLLAVVMLLQGVSQIAHNVLFLMGYEDDEHQHAPGQG